MVGIGMRETSIGLVLIFLLDDSKQSLSKIVRNNISASSLHRVEGLSRERESHASQRAARYSVTREEWDN